MGAIIMSALVSVIAIVGGVYFGFRTRKRRGRECDSQPFGVAVLLNYIYG